MLNISKKISIQWIEVVEDTSMSTLLIGKKCSFWKLSVTLFVFNAKVRIRIFGENGRKAMCALLLYILSFLSRIDHTYPILVSAQKIKRIRTKQLLDPRIDETVWHNYVTKGWVRSAAIKLIVTFMFWQKSYPFLCVLQFWIFFQFQTLQKIFYNLFIWRRKEVESLKIQNETFHEIEWRFLFARSNETNSNFDHLFRTRELMLKIFVNFLSAKHPKMLS